MLPVTLDAHSVRKDVASVGVVLSTLLEVLFRIPSNDERASRDVGGVILEAVSAPRSVEENLRA